MEQTLYASKASNNKLFLHKQIMHLSYKEGNSTSNYLNEFQGCFDKLFGIGINLDDKILALWLLKLFSTHGKL